MHITIIKDDNTPVYERLKKLIFQRYKTQKACYEDINRWLVNHKDEKYINSENPEITQKDLSRWITGNVKMRSNKKRMFADFFGIDKSYFAENTTALEPIMLKNIGDRIVIELTGDGLSIETFAKEVMK
jgi:hypothetical protein